MINWDDFEHIHVIKKLKAILNQWWNVELFFSDEHGILKAFDRESLKKHNNLAIDLLIHKPEGFQKLAEFLPMVLEEAKKNVKTYNVVHWDIGTDVILCPINYENDFMGFVMAVGFFTEGDTQSKRNAFKDALVSIGYAPIDAETAASKISIVKEDEMPHFKELVDLVVQEIITLHKEISTREERISELNKELGTRYRYASMIGKSKPMQDVYSLLDKIKNSESTVLIQGDNGTGKELIAKAIHYNSPRKDQTFVTQNCSAFNDNLLDSELFGHVRGSFTGAVKDKKGLFEVAHKGTFFLDEIADTSPSMQVKLLRVLQEGTFIPVGATEPRKVDVRILAASNKDLKSMVERGEFREDLYYRINVINILVPPLQDRKEDIPILTEHFLEKSAKEQNGRLKIVTRRALEKLLDYPWPGNVRELENEIERLVVLAGTEQKITIDMLSPRIKEFGAKGKIQGVRVQGKLKDALEDLEREMIREGLHRTGWNKSKLAKELGISRAGLIMKVEKYNLDKRKLLRK